MPSSLFASCRRTSPLLTNSSILLSLTFRKPSIIGQERYCVGALRSLGVDEWDVRVIQGMYHNTRSPVRVNGQYSEEFGVGVGVHQGSILSPLLFILVLEALSCKFHHGVPWELFHADDLVLIADTQKECMEGWHGK